MNQLFGLQHRRSEKSVESAVNKKVGEKNENLFSFPSLNRNFALSFRIARRYFRSLTFYVANQIIGSSFSIV